MYVDSWFSSWVSKSQCGMAQERRADVLMQILHNLLRLSSYAQQIISTGNVYLHLDNECGTYK